MYQGDALTVSRPLRRYLGTCANAREHNKIREGLYRRLKLYFSRFKNALCPMPEKTGDAVETHGFLSDEIEGFRTIVSTTTPYKEWFDFAQELNLFGFHYHNGRTHSINDTQQMTITALFIRSHRRFKRNGSCGTRMIADEEGGDGHLLRVVLIECVRPYGSGTEEI